MAEHCAVIGIGQTKHDAKRIDVSTAGLVREAAVRALEDGRPVDLGFVGRVTRVDRETLDNLCYADQVPVIPSMCITEDGEKLNVNADTAATSVKRIDAPPSGQVARTVPPPDAPGGATTPTTGAGRLASDASAAPVAVAWLP